MKAVFGGLLAVALVIAFIFGTEYLGWMNYSFFAPKYEQTRYNVFKGSQSYNEAMLHDLYKAKREYDHATNDAEKATIKAYAQHQFEVFDRNRLPDDLQSAYDLFVNQ